MFKFSFSIGLYDTLCARQIQKQYNNRAFFVELKAKLFSYYWMALIFFNTCSSQSDVGFILNSFSCCFCSNWQIFLKPVWTAVYKWIIIAHFYTTVGIILWYFNCHTFCLWVSTRTYIQNMKMKKRL